jgi:hypothetical protein
MLQGTPSVISSNSLRVLKSTRSLTTSTDIMPSLIRLSKILFSPDPNSFTGIYKLWVIGFIFRSPLPLSF